MYDQYDGLTRKKLTLLDALIEAKKQDDRKIGAKLLEEIFSLYSNQEEAKKTKFKNWTYEKNNES